MTANSYGHVLANVSILCIMHSMSVLFSAGTSKVPRTVVLKIHLCLGSKAPLVRVRFGLFSGAVGPRVKERNSLSASHPLAVSSAFPSLVARYHQLAQINRRWQPAPVDKLSATQGRTIRSPASLQAAAAG